MTLIRGTNRQHQQEGNMAKGIVKLGTDSRGNYQRDLGWKEKEGKVVQHRFYFGTNQTQAQIRCLSVLRCWDAVEARWGRLAPQHRTPRPLWDRLSLEIARAVAGGQDEFPLEPDHWDVCREWPEDSSRDGLPYGLLVWFRQLQEDFPMIRFRQAGPWPHEAIDQEKARQRQMAETAARLVAAVVCTGQTLHQALDAFSQWHEVEYRTPEGVISHHGKVCQKQVALLKEHAPNLALEAFGLEEIEALVRHWQQRPLSKRRQPISRETAKNLIKRIRHFVRWLHKSSAFPWRKPLDYEVEHVRIRLTQAERAQKVSTTQVKTYTVEQLATLWKYASPRERLLMVLALNCGFGQAEITSLQQAEVFSNQRHDHYPITGSFIKRLRSKSEVYGEWQLWEVTERALEWWATQRPETDETALLVTKTGRPLSAPTKGNNRNGRIPGAWASLTNRIRKDMPEFPRLSFNKLRKTAGNLVRRKAGGEMLAMFHSRAKSADVDDQAERYTDRPFDKLFEVLGLIRADLAPVFDTVADPFPADARKRNPSISVAVRERIVALRRGGKEYKDVASDCQVSVDTVRRYLREAGLVREYKKAGK
jgi:hypothetical protein